MTHHHQGEIWAGVGAAMINALAILTSREEHLEFALRCTSLVVGIIVGVLTAIAIVVRLVRNSKTKKAE